MSADDLPELEADALAAIREAKALVDPGADVRARMRSRLLTALPPLPDGGGGGGGEGSAGSAGGGEPTPDAPGRSVAGAVGGGLPRVPLWTVAAALAIGGAAGLLYPRAPVERIVTVQAAPSVTVAAAAAVTATVAAPVLPSIDTRDLPDAVSPAAPVVPASGSAAPGASALDLAAERTMLDVARTALGRGNGANALVACDDHARRFPRGALAEEREAIAVQALVLEHRGEDARARAERFRKTHPRSILLPAVLAAAGVEP